jgi:hypothetical protein
MSGKRSPMQRRSLTIRSIRSPLDGVSSVGYLLAVAAHDHDHDGGSTLSEMDLRVRALERILVEKGYVETAALDRIIESYETKVGPHVGARVIARAWNRLSLGTPAAFATLAIPCASATVLSAARYTRGSSSSAAAFR